MTLPGPMGPTRLDCDCLLAPGRQLVVVRELGMDDRYGEATILVCEDCGRHWLRYLYELEAFSRSGRWYLGHVSAEAAAALTAGEAAPALGRLAWYYFGGSYFGGKTGRSGGALSLR